MTDAFYGMGQQLTALFRQAIHAANVEVDDLIHRGERDSARIDHQLDHMLGFCCDPDMLVAFKRLCRYYFTIDPVATAEHVNAYRVMWDTPDETVAGVGYEFEVALGLNQRNCRRLERFHGGRAVWLTHES